MAAPVARVKRFRKSAFRVNLRRIGAGDNSRYSGNSAFLTLMSANR